MYEVTCLLVCLNCIGAKWAACYVRKTVSFSAKDSNDQQHRVSNPSTFHSVCI